MDQLSSSVARVTVSLHQTGGRNTGSAFAQQSPSPSPDAPEEHVSEAEDVDAATDTAVQYQEEIVSEAEDAATDTAVQYQLSMQDQQNILIQLNLNSVETRSVLPQHLPRSSHWPPPPPLPLDGMFSSHRQERADIPESMEVSPRIKNKRKRLLLLRHASRCTIDERQEVCSVTPHCAMMKRLLRHMREGCLDKNRCQVAHCASTRRILTHYRRCRDPECPVCARVRRHVRAATQMNLTSRL
jgi:hypothetical protein